MTDLKISEVQIVPVRPNDGLVAFGSCVINNSLFIGNIAIYTSPTRPENFRLVYPDKILPNGKRIHCAHPINRAAGEIISRAIIGKFKELVSKGVVM